MESALVLYSLKIKCYHCGNIRKVDVDLETLIDWEVIKSLKEATIDGDYFRISRVPCARCCEE